MPPVSVIARRLLNDLEQIEKPFILALDDVHMIHEQLIFDLLNELVRYPSPAMHLLLITRRDPPLPIPTLRAYRQMTEIRTRDLRFSSADTAGFLTKMLGHEIDDATAAAWTERTEGWVTALCLAAISLRHSDDHEINLDDVPPLSHYLQEYLLAEVMDHLDTALKEWLLTVAWLDRFCPALCAAVSLSGPGEAQAALTSKDFIQQLRRHNLFVIPLIARTTGFGSTISSAACCKLGDEATTTMMRLPHFTIAPASGSRTKSHPTKPFAIWCWQEISQERSRLSCGIATP
ncbi:MAG: hypothetical protein R2844_15540 [Caldilineales bacterium]